MALGHGRAPIRGKQRKGGEGVRERGESFCSAAPQPLLPCTPWKKSSVRKNSLKPQKVDLEKVGGGGGGEVSTSTSSAAMVGRRSGRFYYFLLLH